MAESVEFKGDDLTPEQKAPATATGDGKRVTVSNENEPVERPSWLPEKFNSPEDLAKSYLELEKKLGQPKPTETKPTETKPTTPPKDQSLRIEDAPETPKGLDMSALSKEYMENDRKLTDETYDKLAKQGFDRRTIDTFIAGQEALAERARSEVFEIAGGQEQFSATMEWARENLPQDERDAYNAALDSNNLPLAKALLRGIVAAHRSADGPNLVDGNVSGSPAGIAPFASQAQIVEAMKDPKYQTDPAYRKQVERRLAVTNF